MSDERIELDVTLRDQASTGLDEIAKKTDKVEKSDPTVTVDADTEQATGDLADVKSDATRLDDTDWVVKVRAQLDDAKAQVKELTGDLKGTEKQADDTSTHLDKIGGEGGLHTKGQAIADLTGPLGAASGAASDFAGVFDGIGDIAGDVATKVGLSAETMQSAIGGIGIAVAAGAALWTIFTGKQAEARKKQAELVKGQQEFNTALHEGNVVAAAAAFDKLYGAGVDGAHQLKISTKEAYDFIADGVPSGKLDDAKTKLAELQTAFDTYQRTGQGDPSSFAGISNLKNQVDALEAARAKFVEANGAEKDTADRAHDLEQAMGDASDAMKRAGDDGSTKILKIKTASDQAKTSLDLAKIAVQQLQSQLDDDQAVLNFQTSMQTAQTAIATAGQLTQQQMLDAKQAIIDVGTTAGLTQVQMKTEIDKITPSDVNTAYVETQQLIDQHKALTMQATIQATIDATIKSHSGARFALGPDGELIPIHSAASSSSSASTSIVNVNLPRGTRALETSATPRRHGRRYGNPVVSYARH